MPLLLVFKLEVSDDGSREVTLHSIYHVTFSLFQLMFIYALKGIHFLHPYFHRAAFTNKNIRSQFCKPYTRAKWNKMTVEGRF